MLTLNYVKIRCKYSITQPVIFHLYFTTRSSNKK